MARPCCPRRIAGCPRVPRFVPVGRTTLDAGEIVLGLDELEALRLADLEGRYQEEAACQMGVSRSTFARIVERARRKVADALVNGRAVRIHGAGGPPAATEADGVGGDVRACDGRQDHDRGCRGSLPWFAGREAQEAKP